MGNDKVILAYSGGLDTSVSIKWLQDKYGFDVIALTVNLGQVGDMAKIREKALAIGAVEAEVVDARATFAHEYVAPALKANALYEGKYPLATALGRPLIAKLLVEKAEQAGAAAIAHGCTAKGNDQVRFDVAAGALNPDLKLVAPLREWGMSREEEIRYAEQHGIPVSKASVYSVDENLWGRSIECGVLEDPWAEPPAEVYKLTADPEKAPDKAQYVEVAFDHGQPVALDRKKLGLAELIEQLDQMAGRHGFGRVDMIENRLVGIKSREVYEAPGALALTEAHEALEDLVLERDVLHYKGQLEPKYASLVYDGLWFSPLKEALDAFVGKTQETVTGVVRMKFYKGGGAVVGRRSPHSLYDHGLATYDKSDRFPHEAATGFISLWGLPLRVWAKKKGAK